MALIADNYPLLTYMLVMIGMGMIAFFIGLYTVMIWVFGDAGKKYFQARLKAFSDDSVALLNIFDLDYNIWLSFAKQLTGGVYENTEKVGEKVLPRSVYSINGVSNVLVWDIHPKLHGDLIAGLKKLQGMGCHTLNQLKEAAEGEYGDTVLFEVQQPSTIIGKMRKKVIGAQPKVYTYKAFYDLVSKTKQKYEVAVTIDDVINFIEKSFDKNYRESIEAQMINKQIQSQASDKYTKYAFMIIGIIVLGLMIVFVWKKLHPAAAVI